MSSIPAITVERPRSGPTKEAERDGVLATRLNRPDIPRVIQRLMATLHEERHHLPRRAYQVICDQVLDLASLTIQDHTTTSANGHRAKVEADIRRYIHQHAIDASLDVTVVAQALGWSTRYVQQVLQASNTTARALIRHERLQLALSRLTSPAWAHSTIAHISHSSGFNSHATFATAFRKEFGMTPREARRRAGVGE